MLIIFRSSPVLLLPPCRDVRGRTNIGIRCSARINCHNGGVLYVRYMLQFRNRFTGSGGMAVMDYLM